MAYVLDWTAAAAAGAAVTGGKGWNLGRLHGYGFPVPTGGVVSAAAYRLFLDDNRLRDRVQSLAGIGAEDTLQPDIAAALAALRQAMIAAPIPAPVADELATFLAHAGLTDRPLAVRSSATAEDSAAASFAGIHASVLNVTGAAAVHEALARCYASLWTPQALAYRRRLGLADDDVACAAVVMALVPAAAAGVAFSCDPRTGRLDRVAISATAGLGEALVSGRVEPDEYRLDLVRFPPAVVERRIGRRHLVSQPAPGGGVETVPAPTAAPRAPVLADEYLQELANLTLRIHFALGDDDHPQDVEWVYDGRSFVVVQARPVTRLPFPALPAVRGQPTIWSNANFRDVMPGVQSLLGWSLLRQGVWQLFPSAFRTAGYPVPGGLPWARLIAGRPYFNLTLIQYVFWDAFGLRPERVNRSMGGHQPQIDLPAVSPYTGRAGWQRLLRLARLGLGMAVLPLIAPGRLRRHWRWSAAAGRADLTAWSVDRIQRYTREMDTGVRALMAVFMGVNSVAGAALEVLHSVMRHAIPGAGEALANGLLAGASRATSGEQGRELTELGNLVLAEAPVRRYFARLADGIPSSWRSDLAGSRFLTALDGFLERYGHRGVYELEIMNPRWAEEPTYLLQYVRTHVQRGEAVDLPDLRARRRRTAAKVRRRVGFWRWLLVRWLAAQAARAGELREQGKSTVVKVMWQSRALALEMGRRLVGAGLLDHVDDVFHLTWWDLNAWLAGWTNGQGFRALAAQHQARRARALAAEPPPVVMADDQGRLTAADHPDARERPTGPIAADSVATGAAVLKGTGVSAGRATGLARRVPDPTAGVNLQRGEVMVAPSTDPAWTPLFLRAAAVVMEVGGYLSHGAIVAREYGIPAVANVADALRKVQDGERLTVDGDAGEVHRGGA